MLLFTLLALSRSPLSHTPPLGSPLEYCRGPDPPLLPRHGSPLEYYRGLDPSLPGHGSPLEYCRDLDPPPP